ncbi:MAG: HlyC/CorC family transporter [Lachnospiraceae bacterium]|nr:HlyC/CorC family transporter [Lachnospiraceae bacterium]
MDPDVQKLILIIILILLSSFFSSAETALISVNMIKMRTMAEAGHKSAALVLKLNENKSKLLSTILIGNNIVNLGASALATIFMQNKFHSIPISVGTGILTFIVIIFGEIIPKTAASLYADKVAPLYAPVIYVLMMILTPVIFVINAIARFFMFILRIDPDKKADPLTEEEFLTVVDVSHEDGVIESKEKDMIENVVDFGDSLAKDIMVPRIDVQFAEDTESYEDIYNIFKESNFSRLPIYHESTDNVIGILFLKDFFAYSGEPADFKAADLVRKPYFTFEHKKTSELLSELRQAKLSIAIVLDEYGATAGLITIEDLLEEIVGELRDEYDFDEEDLIKKLNDNDYITDGSARLDEVNEFTGLNLTGEDIDSIAGYIISLFEKIPGVHESISDDQAVYTVLRTDKNRIEKVKIHKKPFSV